MTFDVYCKRLVPRSRSSHVAHTAFRPRHTCSAVTSGFFPPQPARLPGHERQRYTAQHQVPQQRRVVPPLEVAEAELALAQADAVLHIPAPESHAQQAPQRRLLAGIGHEVFLFARVLVPRPDQPEGPRRRLASPRQPHLRRLDLPLLVPQRLPRQTHTTPVLLCKHGYVAKQASDLGTSPT